MFLRYNCFGLPTIKENLAKLDGKPLHNLFIKTAYSVSIQERLTDEYFYVPVHGKALCLICNKSFAVLTEYNVDGHSNSK